MHSSSKKLFLQLTLRKTTFIAIFAIAFSLLTPNSTYADTDPIQTALNKVQPELPLPPNHPLLTAARRQVGADWTIANGYTGKGVSVVVMDTGTQASNVQLSGRIIQEVCAAYPGQTRKDLMCPNGSTLQEGAGAAEYPKNSDNTPAPIVEHGTMVSSAILEFAPDVRIISLRWNYDSTDALKWIIANAKKYNIAAVNMSFGAPSMPRLSPCYLNVPGMESWISDIQALKNLGVASVVSSGNEGMLTAISHPACLDSVVSVGAVDPTDKLTFYSNASTQLKLLAPTEFETATLPQNPSKIDQWTPSFGGTSASSPVVAAMMAIGRSVAPNLSINDLLAVARSTATAVDDVVVKDLRRVNFDKYVLKLLNLKVQGSIDTLTSTPLTDNSVTLKWTVRNAPSQVRVTLPGQASESFPGTNGEKVVTLPASVREFLAKVETVEADGSISSTKEILLTFPITKLTSWCNPTGTNLGTKAPFMGGLYTRGANKTNADLVDLVINIPSSQEGSCIYIEFSPADSPTVAYIGRLGAMPRTGMDVFSVPRSFGTTGTLRLAYVDQNGNFSGIFSYFFPKGSFNTNGTADYGANLLNETDLQPELVGKVQKSLLIDRTVAPDLLALGNLKDAIAKVDEEAAKVKADFDSALALQRQTSESLQKQIEELKRTLSTKSTITCVKGKVSQKVTAVIPSCPAGYSVKK